MLNEVNRLMALAVKHYVEISENETLKAEILKAVNVCRNAISSGNKIIFCGNGGSAADSQHIAAEFTGRFELERNPLPAIALTTDTSALTAIGNDYGFEEIFSRQLNALGKKGDVLIVLTTSGNSTNVIRCAENARKLGIKIISMTGIRDGIIDKLSDIKIKCLSKRTANVQEGHIMIAHIICKLVETSIALDI